jgi:hypothetical protein
MVILVESCVKFKLQIFLEMIILILESEIWVGIPMPAETQN